MNLKFVCFLLILLVLRAGLVKSIDAYENANTNDNTTKSENTTSKEKPPITTKSSPSNIISPDKCSVSGVISYCTSENPYCFVDGDNISCGPIEKSGWRISPLDGLILNNGQKPNPNCILFNPPETSEIKGIIMNLLSYSQFGSGFEGRESAWFNIFEYLGNCPLKSQYCDKDTLTCKNLFDSGTNCTSSNQCDSHYCEKYDINAPDDTTERRCVKLNNLENSFKKTNDDTGENGFGSLLIIISISVGTSILLFTLILYLVKVQQKKKSHFKDTTNKLLFSNYSPNNTTINQTRFVAKNFSLSSLRSSLFSRMSSNKTYSKNIKRDSSDQFSILLPPPPTFDRDTFLYRNNITNNHHHHPHHLDNASNTNVRDSLDSLDSFDIYSPNYIQRQYETSFI